MTEKYDEELEDENSDDGCLILSVSPDGKAELHKPEDYVQMDKKEAEMLADFLNKNPDVSTRMKNYAKEYELQHP